MSRNSRWVRLLAVPTGLASFILLLLISPALGHAVLEDTNPKDGDVVPTAPESVIITFNEPVSPTDGIQILDASGGEVSSTVASRDNLLIITPATELDDGTYIINWRIISTDTHPVAGGFSFSVGEPSTSVAAAQVSEVPRDVLLSRVSAEFLRYVGVLGAVGLIAFMTFIAPRELGLVPQLRTPLHRVSIVFAQIGTFGALVLVPLTVVWQQGLPLTGFWRALVSSDTWLSQTALVAALTSLSIAGVILTAQRRHSAGVTLLAVALGSLIIEGHTRSFGPPWVLLVSDLIHLTAASVWLGGVFALSIVLHPAMKTRAKAAQSAVRRFSAVAVGTVVSVSMSGAILWWRIPSTLGGLPDSQYGWYLMSKVAIVAAVAIIGGWNLWHLRNNRPADLRRLRRTVTAEAVLLAVVVAVTSLLVTNDPRAEKPADVAKPVVLDMDLPEGFAAELTIVPGRIGTNSAEVSITDIAGKPVVTMDPPEISVLLEEYDLGPFRHTLAETDLGQYEGNFSLPIEGEWTISISVRLSEYVKPTAVTKIEVK